MTAIAYPISPPAIAGIGPQDFTLAMENIVGENVSPFTLGEQEQQWPGQMFTIDANLPPMLYPQAEQWIAFLGSLFGKYGTFLMGDYNRPAPQGPWGNSGGPLEVQGAWVSGSNQLQFRNAVALQSPFAIAGDYLQLSNYNATLGANVQRIYKVLQTTFSNSAGLVALNIFPGLREPVLDGTIPVIANCAGTFRLQQNSATWKINKDRTYSISFKAREALLP